jgi:hypothetical protein
MPLGANDYKGYTNPQGIEIGNRASLRPLQYHARCTKCASEFKVSHQRVETVKCPMNCFNRTAQKPTPSARAAVTGIQEAVRSADSASAREFHRQEENSGANEINITGKRKVRLIKATLNLRDFLRTEQETSGASSRQGMTPNSKRKRKRRLLL